MNAGIGVRTMRAFWHLVKRLPPNAIVWMAAAGAIASIGVAAAPLPGHFAGISGLPPPTPVPVQTTQPVSIEAIIALAPFGRAAAPAPPATEKATIAADLRLHGVVIANPPAASSAIISVSPGPAQVYAVGQQISGQRVTDVGSLKAVFRDHVLLLIEGHEATLALPRLEEVASEAGPAALAVDSEATSAVDTGDFSALHALLAKGGGSDGDLQ